MTSSYGRLSGTSLPLEQLIALNDEMASLIRAGVPLELGLKELGRDEQGVLGSMSTTLAARLSRGESLPQALAAEGGRFPRIYRTVVEAGLQAGRLPAALEALSGFAWELLDLRRKIGLALLYPLIVVVLAYVLFLVFILELVARVQSTYETFQLPINDAMKLLVRLQQSAASWAWIPPILLILAVGWWFVMGRRRTANLKGFLIGPNFRYAMFAELLAMQVDHGLPLPEAIVLAADATGTPAMQKSARAVAEFTKQGNVFTEEIPGGEAFPPFLRWLMVRGEEQGKLGTALKLAADMYRRRALSYINMLMVAFPLLTGVIIGGGVTLLYALAMFLPFANMLNDLGLDSDTFPL